MIKRHVNLSSEQLDPHELLDRYMYNGNDLKIMDNLKRWFIYNAVSLNITSDQFNSLFIPFTLLCTAIMNRRERISQVDHKIIPADTLSFIITIVYGNGINFVIDNSEGPYKIFMRGPGISIKLEVKTVEEACEFIEKA